MAARIRNRHRLGDGFIQPAPCGHKLSFFKIRSNRRRLSRPEWIQCAQLKSASSANEQKDFAQSKKQKDERQKNEFNWKKICSSRELIIWIMCVCAEEYAEEIYCILWFPTTAVLCRWKPLKIVTRGRWLCFGPAMGRLKFYLTSSTDSDTGCVTLEWMYPAIQRLLILHKIPHKSIQFLFILWKYEIFTPIYSI